MKWVNYHCQSLFGYIHQRQSLCFAWALFCFVAFSSPPSSSYIPFDIDSRVLSVPPFHAIAAFPLATARIWMPLFFFSLSVLFIPNLTLGAMTRTHQYHLSHACVYPHPMRRMMNSITIIFSRDVAFFLPQPCQFIHRVVKNRWPTRLLFRLETHNAQPPATSMAFFSFPKMNINSMSCEMWRPAVLRRTQPWPITESECRVNREI